MKLFIKSIKKLDQIKINLRHIFNPNQQKQLEYWMANLKNLKGTENTKEIKRSYQDSKILNTPLQSMNPVKDGRTISFASNNGLDKWSSKQCGL